MRETSDSLPESEIHEEWIGFIRVGKDALPSVTEVIRELCHSEDGKRLKLASLLNRLTQDGRTIHIVYTTGDWMDIDSVEDVLRAGSF